MPIDSKLRDHGIGDLTQEQRDTIADTIKNYPWARRYEVAMRQRAGVAVIHVYDDEGQAVFHAKVEKEGSYS